MKFLKKHIVCILIIICLGIMIYINFDRRTEFRDKVQIQNDSIKTLSGLNIGLELQLGASIDTLEIAEEKVQLYQDSLNTVRKRNYSLKKDYERKIADIIAIPTDSLYRDLTRWLDSR